MFIASIFKFVSFPSLHIITIKMCSHLALMLVRISFVVSFYIKVNFGFSRKNCICPCNIELLYLLTVALNIHVQITPNAANRLERSKISSRKIHTILTHIL